MFEYVKQRLAQRRWILLTAIPFAALLVIFFNSNVLKLPFIGAFALVAYLVANGEVIGCTFFNGETRFFRFAFGLFLFLLFMVIGGLVAVVLFQNEAWTIMGMAFAAIGATITSLFSKNSELQMKADGVRKPIFRGFSIEPIHVLYGFLLLLSFFTLLNQRSGWIDGPIWNVIPPFFIPLFFITTATLIGIVLLPGKTEMKLILTGLHFSFSLLFVVILLYPGIIWNDPWIELGRARSVLEVFSWVEEASGLTNVFRMLKTFIRGFGIHVLIVDFALALNIEMYWSYVFLGPILWGFFAPLISYKMARTIGADERTSIFSALLTIPSIQFLAYGKLTSGNSLGNLWLFFFLFLLLRYLQTRKSKISFFMIVITISCITVTHLVPAAMSISFLILAFTLKRYNHMHLEYPKTAYLLLFSSLGVATLLLPFANIARGIILPMLGQPTFSVDKLFNTSIWTFVFGISEESSIREAIFYEVFALLGLIGIAYVRKRKSRFDGTLSLFLLLAFTVCLIDYRIVEHTMAVSLFGAKRVKIFRDMIAMPFVAIVIGGAMKFLSVRATKTRLSIEWKNVVVGTMVCLIVAAWGTAANYETYEYYTAGLMPTSLELEAVNYIDEHSDGRYVVLAPLPTVLISHGALGLPNPDKIYYSLGKGDVPADPSVAYMWQTIQAAEVDLGYFVASSFRSMDFDGAVVEASRVFGLFHVLENEHGEIYIFDYKIPPLPTSPDVVAFHWDTPSAYYVQNDLVRVIINPTTNTLDLVDFWGYLYEGLDLSKSLVDDEPLGNITAIEYFNSANDEWVEWDPGVELSQMNQFEFKLRYEAESLIGVLEGGNSTLNLRWESGRTHTLTVETGDFSRLYIPGLVGGIGSYGTSSRKYGFLYTNSSTSGIMLQSAYGDNRSYSSLTYGQIRSNCSLTLTQSHLTYDLYVQNHAEEDQWANIEVWLPDEIYSGVFPPFRYSIDDGKTWVNPRYNVETMSPEPIRTYGGADVNWIVSIPRGVAKEPTMWWAYDDALGGPPLLPESYTDTGGAQNRMFYNIFLPAGDRVLLRLGFAVYYVRPLQISYVFKDSDDPDFGLQNLEENLIKFYNLGDSTYVGGLSMTRNPALLTITQDEVNVVKSIQLTMQEDTVLSLLSTKAANTELDTNGNGIPDIIEE